MLDVLVFLTTHIHLLDRLQYMHHLLHICQNLQYFCTPYAYLTWWVNWTPYFYVLKGTNHLSL